MSLLELFCDIDDFCQDIETWTKKHQLQGAKKRGPMGRLSPGEIMTIVIGADFDA